VLRRVLVRVPELPCAQDRADEAERDRPEPGQRDARVAAEEGQAAESEEHQQRRSDDDERPLRGWISDRREERVDTDEDRQEERDEHNRLARRAHAVFPGAVAGESKELPRRDREHDCNGDERRAPERPAQATAGERRVVHADDAGGEAKRGKARRERVDGLDDSSCRSRSRAGSRHVLTGSVVDRWPRRRYSGRARESIEASSWGATDYEPSSS